MKKVLMLIIALLMTAMLFTACGEKDSIKAQVRIISAEETLLDTEVEVSGENLMVKDALLKACQDNKMAYTNKDGLFDNSNGIASTLEDGWLFYFNGELPDKGVYDVPLKKDGENLIEMKYVNYAEAFDLGEE